MTIFDQIINGDIKSWKVWEDDKFLAFLTPFPNTPGLTVVIPKQNVSDYVFSMKDSDYVDFLITTRKVAKLLEKAFDVPRVALVFEGTGVAHVHAKLFPLHGKLAHETDVWSDHTEFDQEYKGFITTAEGPKMPDEELDEIQKKILEAAK